jgi:hypothetical protein
VKKIVSIDIQHKTPTFVKKIGVDKSKLSGVRQKYCNLFPRRFCVVRLAGLLALPNLASPSRPVVAVSGFETCSITGLQLRVSFRLILSRLRRDGFHGIPFSSRLAASGTGHQLQNIEKNKSLKAIYNTEKRLSSSSNPIA